MKLLIMIATLIFSLNSYGKDGSFMLEVDPLTFVQDGYSLHIRYHKNSFVYGIGTYSLELPKVLVEANSSNKGFEQNIDKGFALFLDYTFDNDIRGLTLGVDITTQTQTISFNNSSESFETIVYLARVGYHYEPFGDHFFLFPWAGIGYTEITSGNTEITSVNKKFDYESFASFATLHIGFRF